MTKVTAAPPKRERKPQNIAAGARLEQLRPILGFETQVDFAEWLGLDRQKESTYRKWVSGDNGIPTRVQAFLKAEKGVPSDWLMHGDRTALPPKLYEALFPRKK